MAPLTDFAPAKVNLHLHVTGRRADGYHLLDSLVVFAGAGDVLHAKPADELGLSVAGPFAGGLAQEADNLVLRAARLLAELTGVRAGAWLVLEKNLPVASGIGGGSADAAAALRLLCRLWQVAPAPEALHQVAQRLGADVPVCMVNRSARMSGIGEVLAPVPPLPGVGLVLVNPGVSVSTPSVFKARNGGFSPPADFPDCWLDARSLAAWLQAARNDLEAPAMALVPVIADVLDALRALPGCLLARMSGSGATCFGLFASPEEAERAAALLRRPGWWSWGGGLHHPDAG